MVRVSDGCVSKFHWLYSSSSNWNGDRGIVGKSNEMGVVLMASEDMKYGCNSAFDEVILLHGSNCNNLDSKSMPSFEIEFGCNTVDKESIFGKIFKIKISKKSCRNKKKAYLRKFKPHFMC